VVEGATSRWCSRWTRTARGKRVGEVNAQAGERGQFLAPRHLLALGRGQELRDNRNIGDFRKWKDHYACEMALERVLRDLKMAQTGP
jgi:hypothetical protein